MASKKKPDQIRQQARHDGCAEGHDRVHYSHRPKRSRSQQPWNGRKRQANLFKEHNTEQQWTTMTCQEMRGFVHGFPGWLFGLKSVLSEGSIRLMSFNAWPSGSRTRTASRGFEGLPDKPGGRVETKRVSRSRSLEARSLTPSASRSVRQKIRSFDLPSAGSGRPPGGEMYSSNSMPG